MTEEEKKKDERFCLILIVSACLLILGTVGFVLFCTTLPQEEGKSRPEQPHVYWKDIDVEVVDIDKRHWYAGTHHYQVDITVKSEEYGLTETFHLDGMNAKDAYNYDKGDIIKAELNSWVMDSTGEVVRREINEIR